MEQKTLRIALAGNPNCGKTTLFNALTGSNQFVGNWPGVTVEKKEGKLKKRDDIIVTDLPGIYSLSPYTLEEVVARNYLIGERPDAILNIVDGTNLERNLYLTTQLCEIGIPVVIAINMIDVVRKNGDTINLEILEKEMDCKVIEISALKNTGIQEAVDAAISAAMAGKLTRVYRFSGAVEHAIAHIEEAAVHHLPQEQQRFYAIKIFERDKNAIEQLGLSSKDLSHIEDDILATEAEMDDDAESIITNERYNFVEEVIKKCYKRKNAGKLSTSEKIDKVLTNRVLALPIFAAIMFLVYYISVTTVGTWVTDFTNDGLFGDGFFLFGKGSAEYTEAHGEYTEAMEIINAFVDKAESEGKNVSALRTQLESENKDLEELAKELRVFGNSIPHSAVAQWEALNEGYDTEIKKATGAELAVAIQTVNEFSLAEPQPEDGFGWWIPGIPVLAERGLTAVNCVDWLQSLIIDGIIGGVGAVLGFVPQILVLFIFLAFLEACGYMSRIAFVLDRIFRKFGLSGKSFIPLLIGTGCGVPGIMASRTIENDKDRKMTIITTTFIPCGAKLPVIAMIAAALFGGPDKGWWLAPVCYFAGILAVVVSGIMLKKTKLFASDPAPFVMELPAYHFPTPLNVLRSMWERGWSFIKKAGTVILLSTIIIWAGSSFGVVDGSFGLYLDMPEGGKTVLDYIGGAISWLFAPIGFNHPTAAVATLMGLIAKEEIVAVFGVTDFAGLGKLAGFSFLMFNRLCAPCFAAMGAIRREMNNGWWTAFAIGYQCVFAYSVSLIIYQLGTLIGALSSPEVVLNPWNVVGSVISVLIIGLACFMLFRPAKNPAKSKK